MDVVLAVQLHGRRSPALRIVLKLLLNLLHLRGQFLHLDREIGLLAANGEHHAADQDCQQDDAHAVAEEAQIVKQEVHHVGAGGEQFGPPVKSTVIGHHAQVQGVGVAIDQLGGNALGPGELAEQPDLGRAVIEQKVVLDAFARLQVYILAVDADGDVVEEGTQHVAAANPGDDLEAMAVHVVAGADPVLFP